jgi:precorrin-2/cobalt-factor-2 C20-methyltransferase
MTTMTKTSFLTAVGLGPGDPEWITVKAVRSIEQAQVVFAPRSRDGDASLALRIAEPWLRPEQRIVELALPMTRDPDLLTPAWEAAADQIAAALQPGAQGVYLLLGDPLLYGTFTYLWSELAQRHPHVQVSVVPGVLVRRRGRACRRRAGDHFRAGGDPARQLRDRRRCAAAAAGGL